jgi:hypothetical protein
MVTDAGRNDFVSANIRHRWIISQPAREIHRSTGFLLLPDTIRPPLASMLAGTADRRIPGDHRAAVRRTRHLEMADSLQRRREFIIVRSSSGRPLRLVPWNRGLLAIVFARPELMVGAELLSRTVLGGIFWWYPKRLLPIRGSLNGRCSALLLLENLVRLALLPRSTRRRRRFGMRPGQPGRPSAWLTVPSGDPVATSGAWAPEVPAGGASLFQNTIARRFHRTVFAGQPVGGNCAPSRNR